MHTRKQAQWNNIPNGRSSRFQEHLYTLSREERTIILAGERRYLRKAWDSVGPAFAAARDFHESLVTGEHEHSPARSAGYLDRD
jgi:hypothetical protein